MATDATDAPYKQSRAFLREKYGSRVINGSAKLSAKDMTPSAREQRMLEKKPWLTKQDVTERVADDFSRQFQRRTPTPDMPAVPVNGRPSGWANAANPSMATPGMIAADRQLGAVNGTYKTPYGTVGFATSGSGPRNPYIGDETGDRTAEFRQPTATPLNYSLSAPSPVGAAALTSYLPTSPKPTGYIPPWKKTPPASYMSTVLNGASKYIA